MDTLLKQGIEHFNRREFFSAHEVWEQFYQSTDVDNKPFVEALVQLAAAFRLFQDFAETNGPVRMVYQALIRMENYHPICLQVRVKDLHDAAEAWAKAVEADKLVVPSVPLPQIATQRFSFFS